jgi:hypothetical protein
VLERFPEVGENNAALLGAMVVQIQLAAMGRVYMEKIAVISSCMWTSFKTLLPQVL